MPEDILKEVMRRRPGSVQADQQSPPEVADRADSSADDTVDNVEGKNRGGGWLDIRPLRGPGSLVAYSELLQVDYDWPNLTFLVLIFRHVMVTIRGRNLAELFSGVQTKLTKTIQQCDLKKDATPEPGALVVESIEFTYQRLSESLGMTQRTEK